MDSSFLLSYINTEMLLRNTCILTVFISVYLKHFFNFIEVNYRDINRNRGVACTYFLNALFAIFHATFALISIYCWYKSVFTQLITLHLTLMHIVWKIFAYISLNICCIEKYFKCKFQVPERCIFYLVLYNNFLTILWKIDITFFFIFM